MSGLEGRFSDTPIDAQLYKRPEGDVQLMSGLQVGYTPKDENGQRSIWIIGIIAVVVVLMSIIAGLMIMMKQTTFV